MDTLSSSSMSLPTVKMGRLASTTVQWLLAAMLILAFISGAATGYFEVRHVDEPLWSVYAATVLLIALTLAWYHVDSNEQQFRRSVWITMLVFGIAIIGVPIYLIRSRRSGKKLIALGWLFIFACLFVTANTLGEYAMKWMM